MMLTPKNTKSMWRESGSCWQTWQNAQVILFMISKQLFTPRPMHRFMLMLMRLTVGRTYNDSDCNRDTFIYSCDDVVDHNCNVLFTSQHSHSTVISHNQAGYDGRFIVQWCLHEGMLPSKFISQGRLLRYMEFATFHSRFIDLVHLCKAPLKKLSSVYNIDTLKGCSFSWCKTPKQQQDLGVVPSEALYGG